MGIHRGAPAEREISTMVHPWNLLKVEALSQRLKYVQLENCDALKLVERTVDLEYATLYLDPPYPTSHTKIYRFVLRDRYSSS